MDHLETLPILPIRPADAHKGIFGAVGILGGAVGAMPHQPRMLGAPAMCAQGAIRAGCGLVRIAAPEPILDAVLAMCPFATGYSFAVGNDGDLIAHEAAPILDALAQLSDALVLGPGMGTGEGVGKVVLRAVAQEDTPIVLDADAINALCLVPDFSQDLRAPTIVTPHPGEAERLGKALNLQINPSGTDEERASSCEQLAQRLGCVVVLKGARTVVSDGHRQWICDRGHPCMGVGGSGDVLAGIIGSLVAQFNPAKQLDLLECAIVGVHAHAVAGERWAASNDATGGMIATQLCTKIPAVLEQLRGSKA